MSAVVIIVVCGRGANKFRPNQGDNATRCYLSCVDEQRVKINRTLHLHLTGVCLHFMNTFISW